MFNPKRQNLLVEFDQPPMILDSYQGTSNYVSAANQPNTLITVSNNINKILETQQTLITDETFFERFSNVCVPNIINDNDNYQYVEFNIPTERLVKLSDIVLTFSMMLDITNMSTGQTINGLDTPYASMLDQPPFTFLQVIKEIRLCLGNNDVELMPDPSYKRNNLAWRAVMQSKAVSSQEDKLRCRNGLSVGKTHRGLNYINMNSKQVYDNMWYNLLVNNNKQQSTFTNSFTFNVKLSDIIPFMDCDYFLRPNVPFKLIVYFGFEPTFKYFLGGDVPGNQGKYASIKPTNYTKPINMSTVKLVYDTRQLNDNNMEAIKALPQTIINSYWYYKNRVDSFNVIQGVDRSYISFNSWIKERPMEIILYFTNYNDGIVQPDKDFIADDPSSKYICKSGNYIPGINIKEIRVLLTEREPFKVYGLESNVSPKTSIFTNDMSASSIILNQTSNRVDADSTKQLYIPQNLNMTDNIVPIRINLEKTWDYNRNLRQHNSGNVNIHLEIEFSNNFTWSYVNDQKTLTTEIINGSNLPSKTSMHLLFKYPYQVVLNQNNSAKGYCYPYEIINNTVRQLDSSINP